MAGPLNGVRIIDISERSVSAAIAGMILADLGADVIRAEPADGDSLRALPGSRVWLRGQKSVVVTEEEVRNGSWERLRASADVLLHTAQPWTEKPEGLLRGWGEDQGQILHVLTAKPFSVAEVTSGLTDVQPVYGELSEAEYGRQNAQPGFREGPIFLGWPVAAYGAAWLTELGIVAALVQRERTGRGLVLTTSLVDGMAIMCGHHWIEGKNIEAGGAWGGHVGPPKTHSVINLWECSDGRWVHTHTGPRGGFNRMMKVMGREDLIDSSPSSEPLDPEVAQALYDHIKQQFKSKPAESWSSVLNAADVPCMPALAPGQFLFQQQALANGMVDILPDGTRQLGNIAKYDRTPMTAGRAVPKPGQDSYLLGAPGRPGPLRPAARGTRMDIKKAPLEGMLVLDLGLALAGPFSARLLGDLGARVIRIEELGGGPSGGSGRGLLPMGTQSLVVQHGKEAISLDLKSTEGRAILYELVRKADVVLHNMRMAALPKLGLTYEEVAKVNPNIVYCHSTGYGNEGPWASLPTFEPLHSALTGILVRVAGEGNPPTSCISHMDFGGGLTSAVATVAALFARERTGKGQHLEVPQTMAGLVAMSDVYVENGVTRETFALDCDQRGHAPTNALHRTKDGWIVAACYSDREWQRLNAAMQVKGPALSYNKARLLAVGAAEAEQLENAFAGLTTAAAKERLDKAGVPCAVPRPFNAADAVNNPLLRRHNIIVDEMHQAIGPLREVGHTIRFGEGSFCNARAAPVLGQETREILKELGKSEKDIQALIMSRIVDDGQPAPRAT